LSFIKKIAIIGNGELFNQGKFIDSCDEVYRFNNFKIEGYEEHIGTKTTVWCTHPFITIWTVNPITVPKIWLLSPELTGFSSPEFETKIYNPFFKKIIPIYNPYLNYKFSSIISHKNYKTNLNTLWHKSLSTGMKVILYLSNTPHKLYIGGFDGYTKSGWYWQSSKISLYNRIYEATRNMDNLKDDGHDYKLQASLIDKLIKYNKLTVL